ncbi:zinc transporter [Alphaproteobacteria bacterium]|nr:zinc transporter [Alphaproteobacteria bacterium]
MTIIFLKPLLTVLLIAIICGLLGVFVLWKKIAYFGDAVSHSMLLGVVLSALFEINQSLSFFGFGIIFALLSSLIMHCKIFSRDAMIMILSYFSIALAFVFADIFLPNFSFTSYIIGDLMTVSKFDVAILSILALIIVVFSFAFYQKILLVNIDYDLAKIEKVKINLINILFTTLLIFTIAMAVQVVGVFLITALLILPATNARLFSKSPSQMLFLSLTIALICSSTAFKIAETYNLTISAVIILLLISVFLISLFYQSIIKIIHEKI